MGNVLEEDRESGRVDVHGDEVHSVGVGGSVQKGWGGGAKWFGGIWKKYMEERMSWM